MGEKSTSERSARRLAELMVGQTRGDNGRDSAYFGGMIAPDAPVSEAGTEIEMRLQAYSQVCASLVESELGYIAAFRKLLPGGKVLPPSGLIDWVLDAATAQGWPVSHVLVDVPWEAFRKQKDGSYVLPADWAKALDDYVPIDPASPGTLVLGSEGADVEDGPRLEHKLLWLLRPDTDREAMPIPVRIGGILDELRRFSLSLSRTALWVWGDDRRIASSERDIWDQARAATFVLTGYVPLLTETQLPAPSGRGKRLQSAKHLQLAVFTAQRPSESLRERMEVWNSQYPEWAYKQTTTFGWDSLQAMRRLLPRKRSEPTQPLESSTSTGTLAEWIDSVVESAATFDAAGERRLKRNYIELLKRAEDRGIELYIGPDASKGADGEER